LCFTFCLINKIELELAPRKYIPKEKLNVHLVITAHGGVVKPWNKGKPSSSSKPAP
jgi:hypothetical protein